MVEGGVLIGFREVERCCKREEIMGEKLKRMLMRSDLLLVILTVGVSFLLYQYFAPQYDTSYTEGEQAPIVHADRVPSDSPESVDEVVPPSGTPVRFLMYNVHDYFVQKDPPRASYPRKYKSRAEREAVADNIASVRPQIIGLVEIGGSAALEDLAARLARRGLNYPHGFVLERWGENRALAILSMYPITRNQSIADLRLVGRTDKRMLRGLLDVTITTPDHRPFRIVGVHLKSRVSDDPVSAEEQRCREARTLADHVRRAMQKHPAIPVLVYGDWNAGPTESSLAVLTRGSRRAESLRRLAPLDSRGETWTIYYRTNNVYSTFDQIYVNHVLSKRMGMKADMGIVEDRDPSRRSSDHRAVWCDLR